MLPLFRAVVVTRLLQECWLSSEHEIQKLDIRIEGEISKSSVFQVRRDIMSTLWHRKVGGPLLQIFQNFTIHFHLANTPIQAIFKKNIQPRPKLLTERFQSFRKDKPRVKHIDFVNANQK